MANDINRLIDMLYERIEDAKAPAFGGIRCGARGCPETPFPTRKPGLRWHPHAPNPKPGTPAPRKGPGGAFGTLPLMPL